MQLFFDRLNNIVVDNQVEPGIAAKNSGTSPFSGVTAKNNALFSIPFFVKITASIITRLRIYGRPSAGGAAQFVRGALTIKRVSV